MTDERHCLTSAFTSSLHAMGTPTHPQKSPRCISWNGWDLVGIDGPKLLFSYLVGDPHSFILSFIHKTCMDTHSFWAAYKQ